MLLKRNYCNYTVDESACFNTTPGLILIQGMSVQTLKYCVSIFDLICVVCHQSECIGNRSSRSAL